ncbi:hypothetical protein QN356_26080, partial [Pseudomonas sp. CCC3.1]
NRGGVVLGLAGGPVAYIMAGWGGFINVWLLINGASRLVAFAELCEATYHQAVVENDKLKRVWNKKA